MDIKVSVYGKLTIKSHSQAHGTIFVRMGYIASFVRQPVLFPFLVLRVPISEDGSPKSSKPGKVNGVRKAFWPLRVADTRSSHDLQSRSHFGYDGSLGFHGAREPRAYSWVYMHHGKSLWVYFVTRCVSHIHKWLTHRLATSCPKSPQVHACRSHLKTIILPTFSRLTRQSAISNLCESLTYSNHGVLWRCYLRGSWKLDRRWQRCAIRSTVRAPTMGRTLGR